MDYNKVYKVWYLSQQKGFSNYEEIATEADIDSSQVVKRILEGKLFTSVFKEYKQDEAKGDFGRTYPVPVPNKLNRIEYEELKDRYLSRLMSGKNTFEDIKGFLVLDDVQEKQASKMMAELTAVYSSMYEDMLDNKLFAVLEVLEMPSKWSLNIDGDIVEVYPSPVLDSSYRVKAVKYRTNKNYEMPEALFERLCILEDEIESQEARRTNFKAKAKTQETRGRKSRYSADVIAEWVQLREMGLTCAEIGHKYGATTGTVSYHTKKATEAVAN